MPEDLLRQILDPVAAYAQLATYFGNLTINRGNSSERPEALLDLFTQ